MQRFDLCGNYYFGLPVYVPAKLGFSFPIVYDSFCSSWKHIVVSPQDGGMGRRARMRFHRYQELGLLDLAFRRFFLL